VAFNEKYVTVTGGGLHDGSSEANAWTWDEAVANCATGDRVNVKAGIYTTSGTYNAGVGVQGNSLAWRGYTSTIGDLDGIKLHGLVGGTHIPTVDTSTGGSFLRGGYNLVSHIEFTSSANYMDPAFWIGGVSCITHCRFLGNGTLGCTILKGGKTTMHDCYITSQRGNFPTCILEDACVDNCVFIGETGGSNTSNGLILRGSVTNCLFEGYTGYALTMSYVNAAIVSNCTFIDNYKCIILSVTHQAPKLIVNNYFANSTYAIDNTWTYQNRNGGSGDNDSWVVTNNVFKNVAQKTLYLSDQLLSASLEDAADEFVNSVTGDYTLKSSSQGYSNSSPAQFDTLGIVNSRDIGAVNHPDLTLGGGSSSPTYTSTAGTQIYPFRTFAEDDFDKGGTKFHPLS
jgi:hypothetical protein